MSCNMCGERNVEADHQITERHMRNKALSDYALNKKICAANRKGIVVVCNVKSTFESIIECAEAKTKISAKPDEEITFSFIVKNDCNKDDIHVNYIQMAHYNLNFTMNNHGMDVACKPVIMKPKTTFQREVSITFKTLDIGQYDMPIVFSFYKPAMKDTIFIMRDMVVFVEDQLREHLKLESPYAQKEVFACKLYRTTMTDRNDDLFRIPKNYKLIYASSLKPGYGADKEIRDLCEEIREIFKAGLQENNYIKFFHNLLWYEETIVRINLKKYNMSGVPLVPQGFCYALVVPGLGEKRPSLMLGDTLFVKPHNSEHEMFEGVIADIQDNIAIIRGLHSQFFKHWSKTALFDIRFFMSRLPFERMHNAVNALGADKLRVFPVPNLNIKKVHRMKNYFNLQVESNPEQRLAVEHILAGTSGTSPYLVHGPPGTGKTVTIVEAILQLVSKSSRNRILVCTDSNMAADHVATMLMKYLHLISNKKVLLRANSKFRVWETMPACLRKYSNGWSINSFESVSLDDFMKYNIVVTTLSHSAKYARERISKILDRFITHLFIDEAAQASEPAALIPVCGMLAPHGALVLAGDPLQLGPVIISNHARLLGLGLSLMERLKKNCYLYSEERNDPNYGVMLRNNFRSNPDILKIPNDLFYNGQLKALSELDPISEVDILGDKPNSRAIVFHGVLSQEQRMGKSPSYYNDMEMEIIRKYIKSLVRERGVLPEDIGVVTPYIRQVYKIKNWLDTQTFTGKIEVGTVEAFQGKEKRVIIISTVRANCGLLDYDAKFQLGFLVDDKRFNVALTRAKAKVIIIGNPICLQLDIKWRTYIQRCRDLGTYVGYDPLTGNFDAAKDFVYSLDPMMKALESQQNVGKLNHKRVVG